ncbi:MAG: hypothetical protein H5T69_00745 [Chloroflexi bacterium]|nr:hypothetical protein [Chloroflexota bacterium]
MQADYIDYAGYSRCIKLEDEHARVILGPHCGGRVLEYAWEGENALMLDPAHYGWTWKPGQAPPPQLCPSGGRFDVGPEMIIPRHPELWLGPWEAEVVGPATVRMTSQPSEAIGLQLVREFSLVGPHAHLICTQTMKNISDRETRWCYWSRTFGRGHGICLVPLTPALSRFPRQYVMYGPGRVIQTAPEDPAIRIRDGLLEVWDTPANPKLGLDSYAGWFGYLMPNDLLFLKRFPTYPERIYNEVAGLTLSLWYYRDVVCELEPIGPMEVLAPGEAASFSEEWWLVRHPFPERRDVLDLAEVLERVRQVMSA